MVYECYGGSLVKALLNIYPDYNWKVWKFDVIPKGFWKDMTNQRNFFDWVGGELNVKTKEDWYKINSRDVTRKRDHKLLRKYYKDSLISALVTIYPHFPWQLFRFECAPQAYWD